MYQKTGSSSVRTVLVVDDEQVNREILQSLLEGEGYKVVVAENGNDGLCKSVSGVSVILMDVMMPQMDGLVTCRLLSASELTRNIPVLFLSACPREHFVKAAHKAGAYDFLSKPVRLSELRAKLGAATNLDPNDSPQQRRLRYQELVRQADEKQAIEDAEANSLMDQACLTGM